MLGVVRKLFGRSGVVVMKNSAVDSAEIEAPAGDFALVDACLSGWFNTETGELLRGFQSGQKILCWMSVAERGRLPTSAPR